MGFFKNIFGTSEQSEQPTPIQSQQTILDLVKLDLKNIPDDTFLLVSKELTDTGTIIFKYEKKLSYEECGIFSLVEVIKNSPDDYNVIFKSENFYVDLPTIEKLVNTIFLIYGEDDLNRGRFSMEDRNEISNKFWTGRMYSEKGQSLNKHCIMLTGYGEYFDMIIFSPKYAPGAKTDQIDGTSLLEKLKEVDIDFDNYKHENGQPLEISIDEELSGVIKKSFKNLDNHFFTRVLFSEYKDGKTQFFFIKNNSTERDFKNFIDKLSTVLRQDWMYRSEFTMNDLNRLRGVEEEVVESFDIGLRQWVCKNTGYRINLNFTEEEKDLTLLIYKLDS